MNTRLLLDTHAFVWWATGSSNLPAKTISIINAAAEVHVSLASLWEIVLKESTRHPMIGTDNVYQWFADAISATPFQTLSVSARHIGRVQQLTHHHRDPFDRLLIAQGIEESLTFVSRDDQVDAYDIPVMWER